jgi:integrase
MRPHSPWFRKQTQCYYVEIAGRQVNLGKDHKAAMRKFHRLMADGTQAIAPATITVATLADLFLEWCKDENTAETYDWYKRFLQEFCELHGSLDVASLKPFHVNGWVKRWKNPTTRRCGIVCVKRIVSWGLQEGYLTTDPLRTLKKPAGNRRERILSQDERKKIFGAIRDRAFKMYFFALCESGARPGEVVRVLAENFDGETWIFQKHKTAKRTGKPRVIYLTPPLAKLCKRLAQEHSTGPLFRNSRSDPWTRNAIRIRFRNLRKKLKLVGVVPYTVRHSYCTDGLERGVPIATMSELLGHSSTRMVSMHYNHLAEKREHLMEAARQATRRA